MRGMNAALRLLLLVVCAVWVAGCHDRIYHHGWVGKNSDLARFQKGKTTQYELEQAVGPATVTSSFQPGTIYYVSYTTVETASFMTPKATTPKGSMMTFDRQSKLIAITPLKALQQPIPEPLARRTPIDASYDVSVEGLFRNFGQQGSGRSKL